MACIQYLTKPKSDFGGIFNCIQETHNTNDPQVMAEERTQWRDTEKAGYLVHAESVIIRSEPIYQKLI